MKTALKILGVGLLIWGGMQVVPTTTTVVVVLLMLLSSIKWLGE